MPSFAVITVKAFILIGIFAFTAVQSPSIAFVAPLEDGVASCCCEAQVEATCCEDGAPCEKENCTEDCRCSPQVTAHLIVSEHFQLSETDVESRYFQTAKSMMGRSISPESPPPQV